MHTIRYYPYEAGRTLYPIDFTLGILSRSHVYVYVGDNHTEQVSYTWVNSGQISLSSPLLIGQELKIQRVVPVDPINDYESGSRLSHKNLDTSFLQALMLHEEVLDGFLGDEFRLQSSSLIVKNLKVLNKLEIQEATEPNEATTKHYVDSMVNQINYYIEQLNYDVDTLKLQVSTIFDDVVASTLTFPLDLGLITDRPAKNSFNLGYL